MNIRYLVYWGFNIVNDGVSTRPMVISHELVSAKTRAFRIIT